MFIFLFHPRFLFCFGAMQCFKMFKDAFVRAGHDLQLRV